MKKYTILHIPTGRLYFKFYDTKEEPERRANFYKYIFLTPSNRNSELNPGTFGFSINVTGIHVVPEEFEIIEIDENV